MIKDQLIWIFAVIFGASLAVYCPRKAVRELKSGIASGMNPFTLIQGDFKRNEQPGEFWLVIFAKLLLGAMGLLFVFGGIAGIIWG